VSNDPDLLDFNTWRAGRPELVDSGLVTSWNDHATRTCGLLWAGPETPALDLVRAEAHRRGITLVVRPTKYAQRDLVAAMTAIWAARQALAEIGFDLQSTSGTDLERAGVTVGGTDLREPDAELTAPLDERLIASVRSAVAALDGVEGGIAGQDIHVEHRRVTLL
jgi:hypothetical protein